MKPVNAPENSRTSAMEDIVLWLEKQKLIGSAVVLLLLFILIGMNATTHGDPGSGLVFLILLVLILLAGDKASRTFFGSSTLALLIILHVILFTLNPVSLIITFTIYLFLLSNISNRNTIPIFIYLLIDTVITHFALSDSFQVTLDSAAIWIFESGWYYPLAALIPLTFAYLIIERQFERINKWKTPSGHLLTLTSGIALCLIAPFVLLTDYIVLQWLFLIPTIVYFVGFGVAIDRKHKGYWIVFIPSIILFVELPLLLAIQDGQLQ